MTVTDHFNVSLFIPVYNAAAYIPHALNEAYRTLTECCSAFEIVFVDDNSNDQTVDLLRGIEQGIYPDERKVRVLRNTTGPSRRENLAKAFESARYDIVGFIDVDLSCGIDFFVKALRQMSLMNASVAIGSRYIKGAKVVREASRRVMSFFYNLTIQLMFESKIPDHQCGLKIFRLSVIENILKKMSYDYEYRRGWFWDAELLIRAQKAGLKIVEVPVEWRYARTSTFRLFREWKCIGAMLRLKAEFSPWFRKFLDITKFDHLF